MNKIKNVIIVGGGAAGWITALYAKKTYPYMEISVIESEEIGILGAGEGTTPHLVDLFDFLEIPFSDLVKECNATVKNGIKFKNWSKNKNDYFYHPFGSISIASNDNNFYLNYFLEKNTGFSHLVSSKYNHSLKDYSFIHKVSDLNMVPFIRNNTKNNANPILNYDNQSSWAFHFDARLLAKLLKSISEKRGIKLIEGKVTSINTDEKNYIKSLSLENNEILCDFVFDCTGFKRLIIGNFYHSKWISHTNSLPAKKAIPFFIDEDFKVPYTESIAMNYGWLWKIPVQNRYGCGYVFDSDFISEDDAKKEIDDYFGYEVFSPKTINFDAGYYKDIWINNCISIGLSSGFIEPLEATSLWQTKNILESFFSRDGILNNFKENRDFINKQYSRETESIVNFLYLHYITNKKNTDFWKYFTVNNEIPSFIINIMNILEYRYLYEEDFKDEIFSFSSYFYVLIGNGILTKEKLQEYYLTMKINHEPEYLKILSDQESVIKKLTKHNDFIESLKK